MKVREIAFIVLYAGPALSQDVATSNARAARSEVTEVRQVFSPYWIIGGGWSSMAQLHNNLKGKPLAVQPVLLSPAGERTELAVVQLGPMGNATLDIAAAVGDQGTGSSRWGSAVFEYSNPSGGGLLVETAVTQAAKTLGYTITGAEHGASAAEQHAVFWLPSAKAEVYIATQNISTTPIHVTGAYETSTGRAPFASLTLGPSASQIVNVPMPTADRTSTSADQYGAIVLTTDGPGGSLNTSGWIEDESTGFSTMMTFWDPAAHHGTSLFTPQVFLGKQAGLLASGASLTIDSYLVVLNTSSTPFVPRAELVIETDGQTSEIPIDIGLLNPGQSAEVDIGDLQQKGIMPRSTSMGSVLINYNGSEGALMGRVFGVADDPTFGFYAALETYAAGSLHEAFWTTARDWNSFVTVGNFGSQTDQVSVEFTYNGGTYSLPQISLQPLESKTLNVRQLTAGKIPADETYGGLRISGGSMRTSKLVVKEHVISESERISTPFYNAPPYVYAFTIADEYTDNDLSSIDLDVGGVEHVRSNTYWSDGSVGDDGGGTPSSSNTSAVSVTNGDVWWSYNLNAQNTGTSTITWVSQPLPYDIQGDQTTWTAQAQVQGGPILFSCSPTSLDRGSNITCQVTGIVAGLVSQWQFSGNGATVNGPAATTTWSGTMVTGGTVTVRFTQGSPTVSTNVTVNARSWSTPAASAVLVQNGTFTTLPVPPAPTGNDSGLGIAQERTGDTGFSYTEVGSGPNQGFAYHPTNLTYSPLLYQYIINPDLSNSSSLFASKQYGMCGYISYSNLLAQTTRHEAGSVQSHYVNYTTAIANQNPGMYFEARIANPGADLNSFGSQTRTELNNRYTAITSAFQVEPFAVNYSETGAFLGNINYAPYASCP